MYFGNMKFTLSYHTLFEIDKNTSDSSTHYVVRLILLAKNSHPKFIMIQQYVIEEYSSNTSNLLFFSGFQNQ